MDCFNTSEQIVRITFDEAQNISRIFLLFEETATPRSQELFLPGCRRDNPLGRKVCDLISALRIPRKRENFTVWLKRVAILELRSGKKRRRAGIVIAIAYQLTSYHPAMENFVYLPDSNALVNLSLVKHGAFFRQPNLRRAFSTLAVEIRPSNCVAPMSLMKILQVDLQAVQVDLQQAHSLDSQTSQSDRD
jgi:hypothetical protein